MNKRILLFCSGLLTAAISIGSVNVFASPTNNRYSGKDRYETCSSIVTNGWSSSIDYAVLATGGDFADSLSAVTLARLYKAPVLLTEKDKLTASTDAQIKRLKVKTIFISGGTGAVSSAIETQLKSRGISVIRLGGQDRYETAVKIANKIPLTTGEIAIAYGYNFADALSIAPIAAKKEIPLLVVPKTLTNGKLPASVQAYLDANKSKIKKTYVLGGSDYISSDVSAKFPNPDRVDNISADKNCDKNAAIINRFAQDIDFSTIYVATGKDFPDTLAGAALAAINGSPIIFINDKQSSALNANIKSILTSKSSTIKSVIALGGTGAVTQTDMDNALKALPEDSLEVTGVE